MGQCGCTRCTRLTAARVGADLRRVQVWSFVQQFLLQGYSFSGPAVAAAARGVRRRTVAAAGIFRQLAHVPQPYISGAGDAGLDAVWLFSFFLRCRNLYPLMMAHAILGITVSITVPGAGDSQHAGGDWVFEVSGAGEGGSSTGHRK